MDYFEEQKSLLKEEKQYDFAQHENLLLRSSLHERRLQGVSWFPVSIGNVEIGRGDYLTITLHKTNHFEEGHKFRFGMPVALFSNYDPTVDRLEGVIGFVSRDTMSVSVRVDELPDWTRQGKIGVDLLFDEHAYDEMFKALSEAKRLMGEKERGQVIRTLLGVDPMPRAEVSEVYANPKLNASQNKAVNTILSDQLLSLLHGPPGTGKTTTLIASIQALLQHRSGQILVVAPSNTAVDLLSEKLSQVGVSVLRIGNPVRVSEHLQELTLDAQVNTHPANKERKNLEKQARAYMDMAQKYKRNFGKAEREQRKALYQEARKIRSEIDGIQDYIIDDILGKVQVITATLVGANHHTIRDRHYHTVIIDEAAQALEPACWIALLKADKIIMAGDHCQLSPTVKSPSNTRQGLSITLFEKLIKRFPEHVVLLDTQYRMHEQIMTYPSRILYNGQLKAAEQVKDWRIYAEDKPVMFIDTAGAGYDEQVEETAISNKEEALFLYSHLLTTINAMQQKGLLTDMPSIGVITPYRQQSIFLKQLLLTDATLGTLNPAIQVHTIDSFQGQEKDIIYISLVRSNSAQQIGFLGDIRRLNVAMTRAKKKLVVIGDSATIGEHDFYKGFLDYVSELDAYHSVWEWRV